MAGVVAGTLPNDFTVSDLMVGAGAVEAWMGAEASSIDPKVTEEPVFVLTGGLRAPATPSLNDTP